MNLNAVVIPASVKYIGDSAFEYSYYIETLIVLNKDLTATFGSNLFADCNNLNIYGYSQSAIQVYALVNGVPFKTISSDGILESGYCGSNATYKVDLNGLLTISGTGEMDWDSQTPWANVSAFIKKAVIGNGITNVGYECFDYCYNLESVTLPNTLECIDTYAFYCCTSLKSITLPDSLKGIYSYSFYKCNSLQNVEIPASVTFISNTAFDRCTSLQSIVVNANNADYSDVDGVLFDKNKETLIRYPAGKTDDSYIVPDTVLDFYGAAFSDNEYLFAISVGRNVYALTADVFGGVPNLDRIVVNSFNKRYSSDEDGLLYNKDKTELIFCPAGKTRVFIPSNVKVIGENAFSDCWQLYDLDIPSTVTSIAYDAFAYSGLFYNDKNWDGEDFYVDDWLITSTCEGNYRIKSGVVGIANGAFANNEELTTVTIPATVKNVGRSSFSYCENLTAIYVDSNNPNYSNDSNGVLFNKDKTILVKCPEGKKNLTIPNTVKRLNEFSVVNTTFEYVTIPNSVEEIGYQAFYNSSLISVVIPDSVKVIEDLAFCYSFDLSSISIGENVEKIGIDTFTYTDWYYALDSEVAVLDNWLIYVFSEEPDFVVPDGIVGIAGDAFGWNTAIKTVSLPNTLKYIGEEAFIGCSNIESIVIPKNVQSIGKSAFDFCDLTMYGYSDSAAEQYATENNITFLSFDNIRYDVIYNVNGGNNIIPTEKKKYDVDYVITSNVPTRDGFDFLGWATELNGDVVYTAGDVYSENIKLTLYAVWSTSLKVTSKTASLGREILVPVSIFNNAGINSMRVALEYDKSAFELLSVVNGEIFSEFEEVNVNAQNPLIVLMNGISDATDDGVAFSLLFKVKENAVLGEYTLKLTYSSGDVINIDSHEVMVTITNGVLNVVDSIPGDPNGDGIVNMKDSLILRKYLAGWEVEADEPALDVNADGIINMKDALILRKYLAGWDVELGSGN